MIELFKTLYRNAEAFCRKVGICLQIAKQNVEKLAIPTLQLSGIYLEITFYFSEKVEFVWTKLAWIRTVLAVAVEDVMMPRLDRYTDHPLQRQIGLPSKQQQPGIALPSKQARASTNHASLSRLVWSYLVESNTPTPICGWSSK